MDTNRAPLSETTLRGRPKVANNDQRVSITAADVDVAIRFTSGHFVHVSTTTRNEHPVENCLNLLRE